MTDTTDVFIEKLEIIAKNYYDKCSSSQDVVLSHKQVRHFAKCCLATMNDGNGVYGRFIYKEYLSYGDLAKIEFHLNMLAAYNLNHYERACIAQDILKVFKDAEYAEKNKDSSDELDSIPF